jgi:hypothetical protein
MDGRWTKFEKKVRCWFGQKRSSSFMLYMPIQKFLLNRITYLKREKKVVK